MADGIRGERLQIMLTGKSWSFWMIFATRRACQAVRQRCASF